MSQSTPWLATVAATEAASAGAAHIVRLETMQRVTGVPMEPRTALAAFDPGRTATRSMRAVAALGAPSRRVARMLGVKDAQVRVVAHDVGGNFGHPQRHDPEFALICWAARRTSRPVKWRCERGEAMLTDVQGRDLTVTAELALSDQGDSSARLEPQQPWRLCHLFVRC
jgi:carbon-monoxide dehydrogenase large subunit